LKPEPVAAPSRYARGKALFDALVELGDAAAQWAALQATDADEALRNDVWALLQAHRQTTRIGAPIAAASRGLQPPPEPLQAGDRLGPWRLCGDLGEGGMGRVMRAERADGAYEQQVAIKLLRSRGDATSLARLTRERQILASLRHPHIARLLDGGSTPAGQPYLVMELVDGAPIDRWCEHQGADLATRLTLFDQVCDAVAHAHARLVVHCDIKPSNVLVDGDGQVRLLDFGIARLVQSSAPDEAPALTPAYASPEQLAGATPGTASDIFSLGRLLQRLTADRLPRGLRGRALQAVWAMAQAAEPAQRYDSVGALRAELQRLQQGHPVRAWPAGPVRRRYVLALALRRHWLAGLAATGALAMAAAFTWSLAQQRDARAPPSGSRWSSARTPAGRPRPRSRSATSSPGCSTAPTPRTVAGARPTRPPGCCWTAATRSWQARCSSTPSSAPGCWTCWARCTRTSASSMPPPAPIARPSRWKARKAWPARCRRRRCSTSWPSR
jgi:serine/threonine-protein kinase